MYLQTDVSGQNSQSIEKEDPPKQGLSSTNPNSVKVPPINPNDSSIFPESDEDEIEYIKDTLKNLMKAEECAIRSKNLMIESYKSQMSQKPRKIKNSSKASLFSNKKAFEAEGIEEDQNSEIPLEEPIKSFNEIENFDRIHQIEDIEKINDTRIKSVTSFLNIAIPGKEKTENSIVNFNSYPKQPIFLSPLTIKDLKSEHLSFIMEDDFEIDNTKPQDQNPSIPKISFGISNAPNNSLILSPGSNPNIQKAKRCLSKKPLSWRLLNTVKASSCPLKNGWLKKKAKNPFVGWQKCYCKIEEKKFFYFKNEKELNPIGCLDFDLVTVNLVEIMRDKKIVEFRLQILNANKAFIFKNYHKINNDLLYWCEAIKANIRASDGFTKALCLLKIPRFWKDLRICEKQFRQKADTFDIMLFESKHFLSKLQRSFTRSRYDHVAIILRYGDSELSILEAESKGVGLFNWNTFMKNKWYNLYKSISFRHLEIDRNQDFLDKIERFVNMVIGNKYKLNPFKLLRRTSEVYDDPEKELQKREFFCSELVACAYKFLNLLPHKKAATKYWPGSFSKEGKLKLFGKGKLEEQYLIDFSLKN